jgi:hypothetical protein
MYVEMIKGPHSHMTMQLITPIDFPEAKMKKEEERND